MKFKNLKFANHTPKIPPIYVFIYISDESEEFPSDILDPPVDRHIYEFSTGYIAIVGILGFSGNLSVLVSFIRNKNVSNILLKFQK